VVFTLAVVQAERLMRGAELRLAPVPV